MQSAIEQVPHIPEIAEFFLHDIERLEKAFYEALVRAKQQGELKDRRQDLRSIAHFLNYSRLSLTQTAKLQPSPDVLDEIVKTTLSILD
ncbi:hypothetical protein BAG01nite_48510 [Brevibacillus agri]|uniref:Tetrapyrrole biosynthesis glutamyl-tRNA reductase dimerisation domain-containing protein n=1 Tax=Brevibacillus agri TaxID=51101 RepID=A0ABQ0SXS5_9BACL|nr:hypothetical protein BAG01nite_48510 [Brevibacillus agri]